MRLVIAAFLAAKMADVDEARALYTVASELGSLQLVADAGKRCNVALTAMLKTAPGSQVGEPEVAAFYLFSVMTGPTRAM